MAEPDSPSIHSPTSKNSASEPTAQKNPSANYLPGFLYKSILFAVFVTLLPLFTRQFPDSGCPTLLSQTRDLLHLLLVGIAVSYGLFSRRNADADLDKDVAWKSDSPQSYVSRILQVSSMFDDGPDVGSGEERKLESWSSQYEPADPVIVVANDANSTVDSGGEPLLLPLRSLKKSRSRNSETNGSVVLPSPIPWSLRSGRMEIKDEGSAIITDTVASRTPSFRSTKSRPAPPSLSPDIWAKSSMDSISEKSIYGGSKPLVPPPPPPPPRPLGQGSLFFDKMEVKKSFKDELKVLSRKGREGFLSSSHLFNEIHSTPRSVRTVRSKEPAMADGSARMSPEQLTERTLTSQPKHQIEKKVGFMEKMIIVSDDSESENDINPSDVEETESSPAEAGAAEENEVDKKADEFIAKFREQIRLQRIELIKKSSGHRAGRDPK